MDSDEINLNMNEKGTFLRSKLISVCSTFLSKHVNNKDSDFRPRHFLISLIFEKSFFFIKILKSNQVNVN